LLQEGIHSIFDEAWKLCTENDEANKYLMTFQNMLCGVPKWNSITVEQEKNRIIERSGCNYLEDLISCVHIIQLKVLTCIRVGNKQKKIDISIPKLDTFIHKVYIHIARKVYMNVYLFEKNITSLQKQKHNRELELIVQECILLAIRDSIPVERLLRAYLDESTDLVKETKEEVKVEPEVVNEVVSKEEPKEVKEVPKEKKIQSADPILDVIEIETPKIEAPKGIRFDDNDHAVSTAGAEEIIVAPKNIERLEQISDERNKARKAEEESEGSLTISDAIITDLPIEVIA
jgi:hypothetical protein